MTGETMKLLEKERQLDHDILVRFLRIKRIKRQMAEELNPFSEEFDRAAEQLKELMDEQNLRAIDRERARGRRLDLEYRRHQ